MHKLLQTTVTRELKLPFLLIKEFFIEKNNAYD